MRLEGVPLTKGVGEDASSPARRVGARAGVVSKRLLPGRTFEHLVMALHGLSWR